jgi:hypothetical protein
MLESRVVPEPFPCRSLLFRALAFGALALTVGLGAALASCLLLDPPPALPTVPLGAPQILTESLVPPLDSVLSWPQASESLTFVVPVQVNDPSTPYAVYFFEDYGSPNSKNVGGPVQSSTDTDAGTIQVFNFSVSPPPISGCHWFTVFADADNTEEPPPPSGPVLTCLLCQQVTWFYDPVGAGGCGTPDAGGIPDADIVREGGGDAADAQLGAITVDR